jgi:diphthamide synthase (EF-2-diphthine--ammonia ligase)
MMFQSVCCGMTDAIAECVGVPIFSRVWGGKCVCDDMRYEERDGDEVEDLFQLLSDVKASSILNNNIEFIWAYFA